MYEKKSNILYENIPIRDSAHPTPSHAFCGRLHVAPLAWGEVGLGESRTGIFPYWVWDPGYLLMYAYIYMHIHVYWCIYIYI